MLNTEQIEFFEQLSIIQETVVYQNLDESVSEKKLYDVTYELIYKIMELFDGYNGIDLTIVNNDSKTSLSHNIQLHDVVTDYLKLL